MTRARAEGGGTAHRVLTYADVVAGGRRHFLRHGTVGMEALAGELAVSRATLYRLVHGRDRLLGDILWSLGAPMLRAIADEHLRRASAADPAGPGGSERGIDAIVDISLGFYRRILAPGPFRRFLDAERETAVRVLLTPAGGVHERAVEAQKAIFSAAIAHAEARLPEDLDSLAYLYVRIVESLLYADLLSDRTPDLALMARAARAVLTAG